MTKKPVQVYLRADQLAALRALVEREQLSLAELIRQGVDQLLAAVPPEEDPLLNIIGLGDSGLTDLAENHDRYLTELRLLDSAVFLHFH